MNPQSQFLDSFFQGLPNHKEEIPSFSQIYHQDHLIAESWNRVEEDRSAVHHSESLCIDKALMIQKDKYLLDHELFTTMEPCLMCVGILAKARISSVTYFIPARKGEGISSVPWEQIYHWNHVPKFILSEDPRIFSILKNFFKEKR